MSWTVISHNAVEYTLRQLLRVAFPPEGMTFSVENGDGRVNVFVDGVKITIPFMADTERHAFLDGKMNPLWVDNARGTMKIPVFHHQGYDENAICTVSTEGIDVFCDLISPAFVLLSRFEEYYPKGEDAYERFPFEVSLAKMYNMVEIPLVDEYAMLLRKWLCQNFPDKFAVVPRTPRIVPTHDIDHLYRFTSRFQALKSIFGRDLLINRDKEMVRKSLQEFRKWKLDASEDPYFRAIMEFATKENTAGLESVFFFKALHDGEDDATYDIRDARLGRIWEHLSIKHCQIGLHGSYNSIEESDLLAKERERMEKCLADYGLSVRIGRQHYLRARFYYDENPHTLDIWQDTGITDDYTLGFAERCGFRCGTCHPYSLYDVRNDCETNITEHPLIVMDGTLFDYMKLSVEDARALTQRLKQRCLDVEGDFVILWHNHATTREFETYYNTVYLPLLTNDY